MTPVSIEHYGDSDPNSAFRQQLVSVK